MPRHHNPELNKRVIELRKQGLKLRQIREIVKVAESRIHVILKASGLFDGMSCHCDPHIPMCFVCRGKSKTQHKIHGKCLEKLSKNLLPYNCAYCGTLHMLSISKLKMRFKSFGANHFFCNRKCFKNYQKLRI